MARSFDIAGKIFSESVVWEEFFCLNGNVQSDLLTVSITVKLHL